MKKYAETLGTSLIIGLGIFAVATVKGTFLWFAFPYIHVLFPKALPLGILPADLSWWEAVCITWLFASIFPARANTSKSDD